MKRLLTMSCVLLTVCTAFVSCGNDNNSYTSDGDMSATEYVTTEEKKRDDDKKQNKKDKNDRYYDDDHYETDDDGMIENDTGSNDTVKDHADDAIDGAENAGEEVIDGVGDAGKSIIDGVGEAGKDIIDGLDGEKNTEDETAETTENQD